MSEETVEEYAARKVLATMVVSEANEVKANALYRRIIEDETIRRSARFVEMSEEMNERIAGIVSDDLRTDEEIDEIETVEDLLTEDETIRRGSRPYKADEIEFSDLDLLDEADNLTEDNDNELLNPNENEENKETQNID